MTDPIEELAAVLRAENDALRAFDLQQTGALLDRKLDAIAGFEAWRNSGKADRARAAAIPELAATNRRLLELAMEAQKEVLAIIARAARQSGKTAGAGGYASPRPHAPNARGTKLRESAFALHASA